VTVQRKNLIEVALTQEAIQPEERPGEVDLPRASLDTPRWLLAAARTFICA
jgi:hypothetical protein